MDGSTAWRREKSESGKRELSMEKEQGGGGGENVGRGTLGGKGQCSGLTTLPASINPIKVLKIRSHVKLLTCHYVMGGGVWRRGVGSTKDRHMGIGRPPSPLEATQACVTLGLCLLRLWGPPEALVSSLRYLLPSLYFL